MWSVIRIFASYFFEKKAEQEVISWGLKNVGKKMLISQHIAKSLTNKYRLAANNKLFGVYFDFVNRKIKCNLTLKHIQSYFKRYAMRHILRTPMFSMWEWKQIIKLMGNNEKNDKSMIFKQLEHYFFRKMSDRTLPIAYKIKYLFDRRDAIYSEKLLRALQGQNGASVDKTMKAQKEIDHELIVKLMETMSWDKCENIFLSRINDLETMEALSKVVNSVFKRAEAPQKNKIWCIECWYSMNIFCNMENQVAFIPYSPQTNNFGFYAIADLVANSIWLTIRSKNGRFYKSPYIYVKDIHEIKKSILSNDFGAKVFWGSGKW